MIDIDKQFSADSLTGVSRAADAGASLGPGGPSWMPPLPPQPKSVRETGLDKQLLVELIAKSLFIAGKTHLPVLTTKLRLSINVLREVLAFMVTEQLAEVAWRGESDIDVQYQLTGAGKQRAAGYLERCAYAGPAPVPLEAYRSMVQRQSWRHEEQVRIGADDLAAVLGADHFDAATQALLGAAMYSSRSLMLYGPPGSGKTTLAGKLGQLLHGLVAVPYAVVVGQEIIQLYDTALHLPPAPQQVNHARQALERRSHDIRWALCQRPLVRLGAELAEDMLELRHDAYSGCYHAPSHFKANNGMLVIDDLGRQRIAIRDLLNRFMLPLDAGLDQFSLRGGHKFTVPFDVVLVFATSLAPQSLLDASFLRRLGYKIPLGALSEHAYRALFRQQCRAANIALDDSALHYLLEQLHAPSGRPLLPSYPRALLERIADFAGFAGLEPRLDAASLQQAWSSLFTDCDEVPAGRHATASAGPHPLFESIV
ncbi:ATP-binding protein [Janthinobacterium agaricidamnosum]|uniref:ATPase n=1 Tax=Janthinobacterium agaricidamnosum NBRC 102515 = DSM 9628 TaxID=1349767 RepID=W0VA55_9BURK|nr:ATP-binding protein [Janthinobacterium agaricidamnosum]CDG85704.1 ATPase [Janthinobacterium agaricidamnosum NBRC 102515 = DSM 9628]